jgi:hypothetical protein
MNLFQMLRNCYSSLWELATGAVDNQSLLWSKCAVLWVSPHDDATVCCRTGLVVMRANTSNPSPNSGAVRRLLAHAG